MNQSLLILELSYYMSHLALSYSQVHVCTHKRGTRDPRATLYPMLSHSIQVFIPTPNTDSQTSKSFNALFLQCTFKLYATHDFKEASLCGKAGIIKAIGTMVSVGDR